MFSCFADRYFVEEIQAWIINSEEGNRKNNDDGVCVVLFV